MLRYEPQEAVFAGRTGLEIYRRLLIEAPHVLKRSGHLVLELGAEQASAVESIAVELGWEPSGLKKDLAGIERCAVFRRD